MNVAMMQPTFLPWQGMFELINKSDKFIFLDDFQYCPRSHHTRNRLFTGKNQVGFYGVNIKKTGTQKTKLNEACLTENTLWKSDILKRMRFVYAKTAYFKDYYPIIEKWLLQDYKSLADLNIGCIKMICDILGLKKEFLYSSDFTKQTGSLAKRTQRICELLEWSGASMYLCAHGSFEYMKEDGYDYKKYPVIFQNYQPKPYKQIHSDSFVPYLSVVDALFNIGAENTLNLIENGTEKWQSFEEMLKLNYNEKD